jgi:hypothetical protein
MTILARRLAAAALFLLFSSSVETQAATSFEISNLSWTPGEPDKLKVEFGDDFPSVELAGSPARWTIRVVALATGASEEFSPQSIDVNTPLEIVTLTAPKPLTPFDESGDLADVTVTFYFGGDYTEYRFRRLSQTLKALQKPKLRPAKGKEDADVFLSGGFAAGKGESRSYSFESKLRATGKALGGDLGVTFTMDAADEPNLDPDSITVGSTYERIWTGPGSLGFVLTGAPIGAEFSRKESTKNLTADLLLHAVLPSLPIGRDVFLAVEPVVGGEGGRKIGSIPEGSDRDLLRGVLGVNAYLLAFSPGLGLERVSLGAEFVGRFLATREPFTETVDGTETSQPRKGSRPHLGLDLVVQKSKAVGLTVQFRQGSLPPQFKKVDRKVSVALVVKLKKA